MLLVVSRFQWLSDDQWALIEDLLPGFRPVGRLSVQRPVIPRTGIAGVPQTRSATSGV
ncbi:hypothetical protein ACFWY9_04165 [Amycolatopsis sp. NPDC059027]|uniref:hypothetical protein n=1 Tax=unclassified Amycolatopsis TaxID=2618356 RepID=UPI00366D6690